MNLFILRHASAGTRRVNPILDVRRPLDKDGKRHCMQLAHILNAMKFGFDLIVSSPLKRSLQTQPKFNEFSWFPAGSLKRADRCTGQAA